MILTDQIYAQALLLAGDLEPRQEELLRLFHDTCEAYGIWHDNGQIFTYMNTFEEKISQMNFF